MSSGYSRSILFSLGVHTALLMGVAMSSDARAQEQLPLQVAQKAPEKMPLSHVLVAAVSETDLKEEVARLEAQEQAKQEEAQKKIERLTQEAKSAKAAEEANEKQVKKLAQEVEKLKQSLTQKQQEIKSAKQQVTKSEASLKRFQEQAEQTKIRAEQEALAEQNRRLEAEQALERLVAEEQEGRVMRAEIQEALGRIQARVSQSWLRPTGIPASLECQIAVQLLPTGDVTKAQVVVSSGHLSFDRAAEAAVLKASPLPMPQSAKARQELKDFTFVFKPEA